MRTLTNPLSILTSATILTSAGLMLGFISTNGIISQLGILVGRGAILSSVMVLIVLPAIFIIADSLIYKTTINLNFIGKTKDKIIKKEEANNAKN